MDSNFDVIIIGAGISGLTLAERYANVLKKRVLVVDRRDYIGGNCFDFINKDGILVPKHGPHFFHTKFKNVWKYVNKFSEWIPYEHRVLSYVDKKLVPVPPNIKTVNALFDNSVNSICEMRRWLKNNVEEIKNPKNSEEAALARVGKGLYEKIFKNYTKKQWGVWPSQLDSLVMNRIPVRLNNDDRYFTDKYQAVPKYGYTKMFKNMIKNPLIKVSLKTDFFDIYNEVKKCKIIFYSGPLDAFFKYKYGKLQYRSLFFKHHTFDKKYYQNRAQINYPNNFKFTRISEPKHATGQKNKKTTIIKEYSRSNGDEYYPVPSIKNFKLCNKYFKEIEKVNHKSIYFIGRLAKYKYINMDQAFNEALDLFSKIKKNERCSISYRDFKSKKNN